MGSISSIPRVCHVLPPTLLPALHHISSPPWGKLPAPFPDLPSQAPWLVLYMPFNKMETPALPFWPAGFRDHIYSTHPQRASRRKRGGGVRAPGRDSSSSVLTWVYLQALSRRHQQQEWPRSTKAERGSRDSWFPTWILASVLTAALGEPFFAFVSLPLFGRERKFKNYCEKIHPICDPKIRNAI